MKCLVLLLLMINLVLAKKYEICELAKELKEKHDVPLEEVGMLVCFAEERSKLDTQSLDNGNYGLFKFNSRAWCSISDKIGGNCNVKCSDLIDDDITDDVECAKKIILAEGLDAWGITDECRPVSEDIRKECFVIVKNITEIQEPLESTTNYVTDHVQITTETTTAETSPEKLVALVMNKIVSIQSFKDEIDTKSDQTILEHRMKSNNQMFQPKINNFFMFNFNVKDSK